MQLLYKKMLPSNFIQNPRKWNLFSREKSFLRFVIKNYGNSTITKVPSHFVVLSDGKFGLQSYCFWRSVSFTEGLTAWSSRQTFTSRVWSAVERNICDDCVCMYVFMHALSCTCPCWNARGGEKGDEGRGCGWEKEEQYGRYINK